MLYNWFLSNSFNLNIDIIAPTEKKKNSVLDIFIASTFLLNILSLPRATYSSKSPKFVPRNFYSYLSTLSQYYNKWKIQINPEKFVAIADEYKFKT